MLALSWVFAVGLAISGGLLSYLLLSGIYDLAERLVTARRRRWLVAVAPAREALELVRTHRRFPGHLVPALAGLAVAGLALPRSPLLAAYFVVVGVAVAWYLGPRSCSREASLVTDQVERLVAVFHSVYLIKGAALPALEEAVTEVKEPLATPLNQAIGALRAGRPPENVHRALLRAAGNNPYLGQLLFILELAPRTGTKEVAAQLKDLETRLRKRKRLQAKAAVNLALQAWTMRFLQGVNLVALGAVLLVPLFRDYHTSSLQRQALVLVAATAALITSAYLDREMQQLQERVL